MSQWSIPQGTDNPIDEPIQTIIRRKAQSLVGCAGLTQQDFPDLEQELTLRLLRPLIESPPEEGRREAYAQMLVERFAANMLRDRQAAKRDGGPLSSLSTPLGGDDLDLASTVGVAERDAVRGITPRNDAELRQLATDVAALLERLPNELRTLATALMSESLTALSRQLGIPRSTLGDRLRVVRELFECGNLDEY